MCRRHRPDQPPSRAAALGLALAAAAAVVAPAADAAATAPVGLLSHRAAYKLSLAEPGGAGAIASASGVLALEWRADCTGWLSQQRMGFTAKPSEEGPDIVYDVRFSSWEARDYTRLRFQVRNFEDGKPQAFSGTAALSRPEGGEARYTEPEGQRVDLPAGTIFPTEHVLQLIEAARAGRRIAGHHVFDGSGPDALNEVVAVIGGPETGPREGGGGEERRWPVSLAYYDTGPADAVPQFQISFRLNEEGVLRDLVLDYGDFALKGELASLERLAETACE